MGLLIISSMMVLGGMYLIFAFVWWILQIIANWNIFTKPVRQGGKTLFRSTVIMFPTKLLGRHLISG